MRWLGAFSLARLGSAAMRTPLACKLRVTISPWKSLPTFLKVPIVAMSLLLLWFRARDRRGLDGVSTGRGRSATHPLVGVPIARTRWGGLRAGAQRRMSAV